MTTESIDSNAKPGNIVEGRLKVTFEENWRTAAIKNGQTICLGKMAKR